LVEKVNESEELFYPSKNYETLRRCDLEELQIFELVSVFLFVYEEFYSSMNYTL